jgi:hypothetical protein
VEVAVPSLWDEELEGGAAPGRALASYLASTQCDRANTAREVLEQHRAATWTVLIGWSGLNPDSAMSDDNFLD